MPTVASGGVVTIAPKMRARCLTGRGPGGVKVDSTNPALAIGTTGCPFAYDFHQKRGICRVTFRLLSTHLRES